MSKSIIFLFFLLTALPNFSQSTYRIASDSPNFSLLNQVPKPTNLKNVIRNIPYPVKAAKGGIEGLVQVMVQVDAYGNYLSHRITRSSHPVLSSALRGRLSCLQFIPASVNGNPVKGQVAIPFRFKLNRQPSRYKNGSEDMIICPSAVEKQKIRIADYH